MFLTSLVIISVMGFIQINSFDITFLTIALLATVLEQISTIGIDNFIVPISTGICFNIFVTN